MISATHTESSAAHKGIIFNLMRFSLHDGPGIRTTVFLKGCPLSCWWCHNPESQKPTPELMYAEDRCCHCGDCVKACKHGALSWNGSPVRDPQLCELCGDCIAECMAQARRMAGESVTVEQLLRQVRRDLVFYEESGGGVTFSGGEPLMQSDFLIDALKACRVEGIHTAVDTCGFARQEILALVSEYTNLFLFDLKLMDPARHKEYTGVDNALILQNLEFLVKSQKKVFVRIPIVPGVNDDDESIEHTQEFLKRIGQHHVDLLAYHETGADKYRRLQSHYRLDVKPPSEAHMKDLSERFAQRGFTVRIGG